MKDLITNFNERYLSKKEIEYRVPNNTDLNEFWNKLMDMRRLTKIEIPLIDQSSLNFWFNLNNEIINNIEKIDNSATEDLFNAVPMDLEVSVIADALIDEAFNSSVIEGAFSTKRRTKEMIEKHLEPSNKSEKMIMNNYRALLYINDHLDETLDENIVLSIYGILTQDTLNDDDIVEKYRTDAVYVWDSKSNKVTYTAPIYLQVQDLMNSLLDFMNSNNNYHPVTKACIIHFYFVYIHPFFDGNGRTARAVSYMYLLQNGYKFFKFFSISSVINEEKNRYYDAIENTEEYGSDMTYFIKYYSSMIVRSISKIKNNFRKEFGRKLIKNVLEKAGIILEKRQKNIVNHFITIDKKFITIDEYKKKFKISYETARTDLLELETIGFFKKSKKGKKYIFIFNDFNDIIKNIQNNFIDFIE
ncbi:Fic family protein [Clostridium sp.]|uniref:Fic family protein n=1 Tax=Clostridium sp. TaxID=1506 RepID=UPI001A5E5E5F|nr:Fic family protein [Clostridium sp.]MBK5243016.1 Fic family protein [Clostridium sp.]